MMMLTHKTFRATMNSFFQDVYGDQCHSNNNNILDQQHRLPTKDDLEPCNCHPHIDSSFDDVGTHPLNSQSHITTILSSSQKNDNLQEQDNIRSESSSRDSIGCSNDGNGGIYNNDNNNNNGDNEAANYAKLFRTYYIKLARSIDKDWYEDKTIFYLVG